MGFFSAGRPVTTISAAEAHRRMQQGGCMVLDVRMPAEYRQIRIKGAKLLPLSELGSRAASELPNKNTPLLIYCQSGARANSAVKTLRQMGYANAVSFGGIANWPYETVRG